MLSFPGTKEFEPNQRETSRSQLEKIYFKHKKKKRQIDEIANFNQISNLNNLHKEQAQTKENQSNPWKFQTSNLLNETEVSFKTVEKVFTHISCFIHVISVLFILFFAKESSIFIKIACILLQGLVIGVNLVHYKQNFSFMCLNTRSKFIKSQIGTIAFIDILSIILSLFSTFIYCVIVMILADATLIKKLQNLYQTQKRMDVKFPDFEFDSTQAFENSEGNKQMRIE